jgi:hypothetical protein
MREMALAAAVFVLWDAALLREMAGVSWERWVNCGAGLLAIWAALHLSLEAIGAYEARIQAEVRQAKALAQAGELAGHVVMVCAWTKRVKEDGQWVPLEEFLERHFQVRISHGMSDSIRQELSRQAQVHESTPNSNSL